MRSARRCNTCATSNWQEERGTFCRLPYRSVDQFIGGGNRLPGSHGGQKLRVRLCRQGQPQSLFAGEGADNVFFQLQLVIGFIRAGHYQENQLRLGFRQRAKINPPVGNADGDECYLDCSGGATCPTGMSCFFGDTCLWDNLP